MTKNNTSSRRDFLKTTGALAAGATLVGGLGVGRSAHAAGSDLIKVALVGCGGRGSGAIRNRLKVGDNVKVVAVADAFEFAAKKGAENLRNESKSDDAKFAYAKGKIDLPDDRVFSGIDCHKKAIDCLGPGDLAVIATPPGFRPFQYRYAIEKGAHVFMEKPCCVDAPGYRSLMETNKMADEKNLKVCVGLQRRHDDGIKAWMEKLHGGIIGDLSFTRVYWNSGQIWCRNRTPEETEMQFQMKNWYHFLWLCGDNICEQHIHNLDMGLWMHGKGDPMCHPIEVNAQGGRQNKGAPEEVLRTAPPFADRNAWNAWYEKNRGVSTRHGQAWDHFFCEYTFADGSKMFSQCRHINNCFNSVTQFAHGTKGWGNVEGKGWFKDAAGNEIFATPSNPSQFDLEHVRHTEAIRENKPMNNGWYGANSSMTAVFGRMAAFSGKVLTWDEAVAKGKAEMPVDGVWDWNVNAPVMPDADGFYEGSVAKQGAYDPYVG